MQIVRGKEISSYIEELGGFRVGIFKEFPYLYDGDMEYEQRYLSRYAGDPDSILIIKKDREGLVGACTGIPLRSENEEFRRPFSGEDIDQIYYIGEVMVRPDVRHNGVGANLLSTTLCFIDPKRYKKTCLYTVDRGDENSGEYRPSGELWQRCGFSQDAGRKAFYHWKDINNNTETDKSMDVWVREN